MVTRRDFGSLLSDALRGTNATACACAVSPSCLAGGTHCGTPGGFAACSPCTPGEVPPGSGSVRACSQSGGRRGSVHKCDQFTCSSCGSAAIAAQRARSLLRGAEQPRNAAASCLTPRDLGAALSRPAAQRHAGSGACRERIKTHTRAHLGTDYIYINKRMRVAWLPGW